MFYSLEICSQYAFIGELWNNRHSFIPPKVKEVGHEGLIRDNGLNRLRNRAINRTASPGYTRTRNGFRRAI